jgi:hypothetical protein
VQDRSGTEGKAHAVVVKFGETDHVLLDFKMEHVAIECRQAGHIVREEGNEGDLADHAVLPGWQFATLRTV